MREQNILVPAVRAAWMDSHPALVRIEKRFGYHPERLTRDFYLKISDQTRFNPHVIQEGELVPYEACVPFAMLDTFHFLFPKTSAEPLVLTNGERTYATAPILMCHGDGVDDEWKSVAANIFAGMFVHAYKGMWGREIQQSKAGRT